MMRHTWICLLLLLGAAAASAGDMAPRDGWSVMRTAKTFDALVADVRAAAKQEGLAVVTQAGPTGAAAERGITIPGNRVIGIFNNDFAVRTLALSTAAMIEAPIRVYVTENSDGTATLSYKLPSRVFAPYADDGGAALAEIGATLDQIFVRISVAAAN